MKDHALKVIFFFCQTGVQEQDKANLTYSCFLSAYTATFTSAIDQAPKPSQSLEMQPQQK